MWNTELKQALLDKPLDKDFVLTYLASGADVNESEKFENGHFYTPLSWAIEKNHDMLALQIIELDSFTFKRNTVLALLEAIRYDKPVLASLLLKKIKPEDNISLQEWRLGGKSALYLAAEQGMLSVVSDLMDLGANPHFTKDNNDGIVESPLAKAMQQEDEACALLMLTHQKFTWHDSCSALLVKAIEKGFTCVFDLLLNDEKTFNVDNVNADTLAKLLAAAVKKGSPEIVERLMNEGADFDRLVDIENPRQLLLITPLALAMLLNREKFALIMLNHANFSFTKNTFFALTLAVGSTMQARDEIVSKILEAYRKNPIQPLDGISIADELKNLGPLAEPLMASLLNSNRNALAMLLDCLTENNKAALMIRFVGENKVDAVNFLLDKKVDPSTSVIMNDASWTPLLKAIALGYGDLALMMVASNEFVYTPGRGGAALCAAKVKEEHVKPLITNWSDLVKFLEHKKKVYNDDLLWDEDPADVAPAQRADELVPTVQKLPVATVAPLLIRSASPAIKPKSPDHSANNLDARSHGFYPV